MTATQPLTETTVLANDVKMPTIGFGTWQIPINENFDSTIQTAIQLGYRQFDTAQIYNNAQRMGEAIRASDVPRSEFFLTSKIWASPAPSFTLPEKEKLVRAMYPQGASLGLLASYITYS